MMLWEPGARSVVLGFRILLLLLALSAAAAAVVMGRARDREGRRSGEEYACPMHPEIVAPGPGLCPICRMELEAVGASARSSAVSHSTFQAYDYVRRRGLGQDLHAPAWIDDDGSVVATLYGDELAALRQDAHWVFSPSTSPTMRIEVHPTSDLPNVWDRSTSRVRFRGDAAAPVPQPGEVGWLRVGVQRLEVLVVPDAAVLESADGPYVLVTSADGRSLTPRSVQIGRVLGGLAVVLSGLRIQERVLVRGAFFVDAERRLRRQAGIELTP